jgi:hypothetical protein
VRVLPTADGGHAARRAIYYRCAARSIVPGSPILDTHPKNVYLPEAAVLEAINGWIGSVFDPARRDETVQQMLGAAGQPGNSQAAAAERALAEAETTLRRLQTAIEAGADPAALVDPLNRAQERVMAAGLERDGAPSPRTLGRAEVEAMLDYLGDVGAAFKRATPEKLAELYTTLSLELIYHPDDRLVDVAIRPRRGSERVRGRSCALTTRLLLPAP